MKMNRRMIVLRPEVTIARLDLMIANCVGDREMNEYAKLMVQSGEVEGYECPENPMLFTIGYKNVKFT